MTYANATDVRTVLGKLGPRLPAEIDVSAFLAMAHAEIVDTLAEVYPSPDGLPAFAGDGLESVRWAEAKLAAAEILDVLRATLPAGTLGDTPDELRASAARTLSGGVVGYPPGSTTDDPNAPGVAVSAVPRVSSFSPVSNFPDPYAQTRGDPRFPWL